jgi:hypothetical protein
MAWTTPIAARRVFRLASAMALALAAAYGFAMPLPFLAPLFVLMLGAVPAAPIGPKALVGLVIVVLITLGVGLVMVPLLESYPVSAVLMVAAGLFFGTWQSLRLGNAMVGTLLGAGLTLIPAAGVAEFALAVEVIRALAMAIALAVVCLWLVYPWFPEDPGRPPAPPAVAAAGPAWVALRTALIVLPPFLIALTNPASYLPLIMKSLVLGKQGSEVSVRTAGRELLGSTLLGGCAAIVFWFALKLHPTLWMFAWWMAFFGLGFAAKLFGVWRTRWPPSFWINACVTMLILLGPAVEDTTSGKDVKQAFATRMALFVAVTLYAWAAVFVLERVHTRRVASARSGPFAVAADG